MRIVRVLPLVIAVSVLLTGCVTVKKVVRERVDQDVSGNKGYLKGTGTEPEKQRTDTREYIDVKVELPTWGEITGSPEQQAKKSAPPAVKETPGAASEGNKGYITGSSAASSDKPLIKRDKTYHTKTVYERDDAEAEIITGDEVVYIEEEVVRPVFKEYTVKQGDTLSHIAKAFYDKASKWTVIYEANSDKLKDPASIKPGMVLIIPDLKEAESEYLK